MKLRHFFTMAIAASLVACSSPYKATDSDTSTSTGVIVVPEATKAAFTSQYPGATNTVWTSYDAQAEVPIDWELSG